MKKTVSIILLSLMTSVGVQAADCGAPPVDKPTLPEVTEGITADQIRAARNAVVAYSTKVTEYLTCMDDRMTKLRPFMTKEQNSRYSDDTADMHEERIALEEQMNEVIRAYRNLTRRN